MHTHNPKWYKDCDRNKTGWLRISEHFRAAARQRIQDLKATDEDGETQVDPEGIDVLFLLRLTEWFYAATKKKSPRKRFRSQESEIGNVCFNYDLMHDLN